MLEIRRGENGDLYQIEAIQAASPEAPHWEAADYLQYELRVAMEGDAVAGFLAWRTVAEGEHEILNLAVAPEFRRRGVGRRLLRSLLDECRGTVFLEVRESNRAALELYQSSGFHAISRRPGYYEFPLEAAIVMKFHSC